MPICTVFTASGRVPPEAAALDGELLEPEAKHAQLCELKVGLFIKVWSVKEMDSLRCEVVELDTGGDVPVKVRWPKKGTKKAKDSWVPLEDCRVINEFGIDWEDVDRKLPIKQDPNSRRMRKAIFSEWDTKRNKLLSLKELQTGVSDLLGAEFGPDLEETSLAIKCAWKASKALATSKKNKKVNDANVNLKEFHAFIAALRYFLELAELFERLDTTQEDDQKLSLRECRKGDFLLEAWGIGDAELSEKFAGKEPWTPCLKFEDFANWCVEKRWSYMNLNMELDSSDEEVVVEKGKSFARDGAGLEYEDIEVGSDCEVTKRKVMQTFKEWDTDRNGSISVEELTEVFSKLNSKLTAENVRQLFSAADVNKNGQVDYEEFCSWIFG